MEIPPVGFRSVGCVFNNFYKLFIILFSFSEVPCLFKSLQMMIEYFENFLSCSMLDSTLTFFLLLSLFWYQFQFMNFIYFFFLGWQRNKATTGEQREKVEKLKNKNWQKTATPLATTPFDKDYEKMMTMGSSLCVFSFDSLLYLFIATISTSWLWCMALDPKTERGENEFMCMVVKTQ